MSKVKVSFLLSDEYRKAKLVESGERIDAKQTIEIDVVPLSPEARQQIIDAAGAELKTIEIVKWGNWSWGDREPTTDPPLYLDDVPTLDDVVEHCVRMFNERRDAQAIYDQAMREKIQEYIDETINHLRECITNRVIDNMYCELPSYLESDRKRLGMDTREYDALRAQYDAMAAERSAEIAREHEKYKQAQQAERDRIEKEKEPWIEAHGSDYLKKACVAHGYDCQRLYVTERAKFELPGYVVDFEDAAKWKSRSCPSEESLAELERVEVPTLGDVEIVWLTGPAQESKQEYDDESFEPSEAAVVRNYLGKYDLVKIM
jgi:hypothetical protein